MLVTVIILLGLMCLSTSARAEAPTRSVDTIAWAIGVDHGHIPIETRRRYAAALRDAGRTYDFDPLTGVALIQHESRFRPGAIGDHGAAVGLAQIHYQHLCDDADSCERKRQSLLDPVQNIHAMGRLIALKRRWCREQTGRPALFARWLHAYGYNQTRNVKCNQTRTKTGWKDRPVPTAIKNIIGYRKRLLRLLRQRDARKPKARAQKHRATRKPKARVHRRPDSTAGATTRASAGATSSATCSKA